MRITVCGHAGVLVESGTTRLLVDPVFTDRFAHGAFGFRPARSFDRSALGELSAVLVTHRHLDHWHPATLREVAAGVPLLVPPDGWLAARCAEWHPDVRVVTPWERVAIGDGLSMVPTPSTAELAEVGALLVGPEGGYWHMSDAAVTPADGARVAAECGRVAVVATRYQPVTALVAFQRGLGSSFDERPAVIDALEAACAAEPELVFPYFAGIEYVDEHAWANRYAFPYDPAEIVRLLDRRFGEAGRARVVAPGDVVEITDGGVALHPAASPFVVADAGQPADASWAPFELDTLTGLADPAEVPALRSALESWLGNVFGPWLRAALDEPGSPFTLLAAWGVVWQVTVRTGSEPLRYAADFRDDEVVLRAGGHPDANLLVELGGRALQRLLAGEAGPELFYLSGQSRLAEKVLYVDAGRIHQPALGGWDFWEALPEPLTHCLRTVGLGDAVTAG